MVTVKLTTPPSPSSPLQVSPKPPGSSSATTHTVDLLYAGNDAGTDSPCTPSSYHACITWDTAASPLVQGRRVRPRVVNEIPPVRVRTPEGLG